ncbi:helix-turn-helix transcriptional regulator [Tianweitania aestuarii]|nr:helix-turn-helix transcriptional regulator [Tianweitania aestuarii]
MKALRQRVGLSQAALARAIGMSRESIGRMERSTDVLERRTELAVRYVAERGLPGEPSLERLHQDVADLLDDASVRADPSSERSLLLKKSMQDWISAGGSDIGRQMLYRAQGVIGLINVTSPDDPMWPRTLEDLVQLKRDWAGIRS